jgi:hypothetical protein
MSSTHRRANVVTDCQATADRSDPIAPWSIPLEGLLRAQVVLQQPQPEVLFRVIHGANSWGSRNSSVGCRKIVLIAIL